MTVVKIFDPKEKPFGWLSNNYTHFMRIDDNEWRNVTSYIYGNILKIPTSKQIIRLIKNTKEILPEFRKLYQAEIDDIKKNAIEKALKIKFENEKLSKMLIDTDNAPIFYVSQNKLLGVGPNNDGQNLYGKYLMQIRHILRVASKNKKDEIARAEKDQLIYDIYLAEKGLIEAIQAGDDLKKYINKTPAEIVDHLGRNKLMKLAPERDFILENVHKGYFKNISSIVEHPDTMVLEIRKKYMRILRVNKLKERKNILFDMYADYLLQKHYPDLEPDKYAKAKEQQFNDMGWQQKNDLEDRLFELFEKGMLSNRLSDAFDERMSSFYIPSEEEVMEAENLVIAKQDKPSDVTVPYVPSKGEPILVFPVDSPKLDPKHKPYVLFSPISLTGMLPIDGRNYPTVTHFIIASLIAYLPEIGGLNHAYPYLLAKPDAPVTGIESFLHPDAAQFTYENMRDNSYHKQLRKYAREGLKNKFNDRVLQDILLMTGDAKLVWNDFVDPILGIGPKEFKGGENFVGKYLMKLRDSFAEQRKDETLDKLHEKHITFILDEDPFMKEWLRMRVRDTCKVLKIMKNYLWVKDGIDIKYNANFVTSVIDKIYQPCSHIFGSANKITAKVPDYFRFMVQDCPDFSQIDNDVVEVIWKRVAVIMYYLIKHLEDSTLQNLRAVIARIELMVTKGSQCIYIIPDDYDNCIVSAIINIIRGISEFNKQFSYNIDITELDIKTATSIILNTEVSQEIKPYVKEKKQEKMKDLIEDPYIEEDLNEVEEEELIFPDDDNEVMETDFMFPDDDEEGENDYGDGEEDQDDIFSPRRNMLISVLREIENIKDPEEIALTIEGAIETIKTYSISNQIKRNRINFFSTQR